MSSYPTITGELGLGYRRSPRIATLPPDDPRHGLGGYNHDGCRCDVCVWSKRRASQRAKQRRNGRDPDASGLCSTTGCVAFADLALDGRCRGCRRETRRTVAEVPA